MTKLFGLYLPTALTILGVFVIVRFGLKPPPRYARAFKVGGWVLIVASLALTISLFVSRGQ